MQKAMLLAKIFAATTLGLSVLTFASTANATNLVPNTEGEIKTDIDCIVATCIDPTTLPFSYSVTSKDYDSDNLGHQFGKSRLFVDDRTTDNDYGFGIKFGQTDAGTNPPAGEYWFRPVAISNGTPFEGGQLEVGRFLFDFLGKTAASVTFDLFDVEDANFTRILKVNGLDLNPLDPKFIATAGANGNRQQITIYDVKSFEIQLGNPGPNSTFKNTGDGVAMRASVPEPSAVISLGAMSAVAGMFSARQRKKANIA
ncbi:hypothetical protein NIES4071_96250 [Calothrix sp. NIES-4071]|nr:hypothetical protein NIES4071_96250 [Calothrix sp. NIES-4071]BAZ63890.1 hypothetical protein NIES4105_96180 [Calothrix sp. NIES-4105]